MKITRINRNTDTDEFLDWHKLVVAEAGFSRLDVYGRRQHGLDIQTIRRFANEVNRRNEPGTLHPKASISAMPRRYFRDVDEADIPEHIGQFRSDLLQIIEANQSTIRASHIVVDLHVSPKPVPETYVQAVEDVLRAHQEDGIIEQVVIFT